MNNSLNYKGYAGSVQFDASDRIFHGRVLGIADIIGFEGESVTELEQDFRNAVDDYLETCREMGKAPEKPVPGKVILEIPPDLLAFITIEAGRENKGIEAWIADTCRKAVEKKPEPVKKKRGKLELSAKTLLLNIPGAGQKKQKRKNGCVSGAFSPENAEGQTCL